MDRLKNSVPRTETCALLMAIQNSTDPKEKQRLAWRVVMLNDAASSWLARRFCPHPNEDDVSEARLAMYDAALYCHPERGSSYLTVAAWYYMRRTTGTRNGAGIHIPANVAQIASRVRKYMSQHPDARGESPTLADAIRDLDISLSETELSVVLWSVGNPNGNNVISIGAPSARRYAEEGDESPYDIPSDEPERESRHDVEKMRRRMRHLTPFQLAAIKSYVSEGMPLKDIGEEYGVSREWVNQTRKKVMRDLRASLRVEET